LKKSLEEIWAEKTYKLLKKYEWVNDHECLTFCMSGYLSSHVLKHSEKCELNSLLKEWENE